MDDILKAAQALSDALKNSEIYKNYRKSHIGILANPEVSRRIHDFKKKQTAYELKRLQNIPNSFEDERHISHLYSELVLDEAAKNFINCEDEFLTTYHKVMEILNEACNIEGHL